MEIIRTTPAQAVPTAAQQLLEVITAYTEPVLLLCPGGSSLAVLKEIAKHISASHVTIGILDERFNAPIAETNSESVMHLFPGFGAVLPHAYRSKVPMQEVAQTYDEVLRSWSTEHPNGKVVALSGVGADGHIAGIFPQESAEQFADLYESHRWVVGAEAPGAKGSSHRISTTCTLFREKVDNFIIFISGEEKRSAVEKLLAPNGTLHETPARILHELKHVIVVTDVQ